jgi:hypothetical protein
MLDKLNFVFFALFADRSVPAKAPEQQSTAQLAIFYNGMVNVYDVPAEKVLF